MLKNDIHATWLCCNSASTPIMAEYVTQDVIYIFVTYRCDQSNANWWGGLGSVWAFITLLPAILAGDKLRITDSVWSESAPLSWRKSSLFMWKLTSACCPQLCWVWFFCWLKQMQAHCCDLFPSCPLGYTLLPRTIANSLSIYNRNIILHLLPILK